MVTKHPLQTTGPKVLRWEAAGMSGVDGPARIYYRP